MAKPIVGNGGTVVVTLDAVLCFDGAEGPIPYPGVKRIPTRLKISMGAENPGGAHIDLVDDVGVKFTATAEARHYGIGFFDKRGKPFCFYRFKDDFPDLVLKKDETITASKTIEGRF